MAKAILELPEMPKGCFECVLSVSQIREGKKQKMWVCVAYEYIVELDIFGEHYSKRHPDCPLKMIEEKEGE